MLDNKLLCELKRAVRGIILLKLFKCLGAEGLSVNKEQNPLCLCKFKKAVNKCLDHDKEILEKLDVVVGAVHSKFNMTMEEMTDRIIKAMSTGLVNIIAHPTGRLVDVREPYPVDMSRLMRAAKKYNVILELNSYPDRLDLSDSHCRLAKDMGVMVTISTDSYNRQHLDYIRFGVYTARRGWLEKRDVLNTRPVAEVLKILKNR